MDGYRFSVPYAVRSSDINAAGHVANARVLDYFQDGRAAYLAQVADRPERDVGGGLGLIIPEVRVQYRAEIFLGDPLEIGVRVDELRRTSFVMSYRIERRGEVVAEGTTPLVVFDYGSRRPAPIPETFREAVAAFEGLPIAV